MFHHGSPTEREASSPNIANQKSSPVIYRVSNPLMMTMTPALLYIRVARVTSSARPLLLPPGSVGCRGSRAQSWMRNFYKGKHMIRDGNLLEAKWRPKFPPPYTRPTWPYPALPTTPPQRPSRPVPHTRQLDGSKRRPVVSKLPLHSRAAAKMLPHIRIGPEPSPPAVGSHRVARTFSAHHSEQNFCSWSLSSSCTK